MIVFNDAVFIHIPKTSGAFVRHITVSAASSSKFPIDFELSSEAWHIGLADMHSTAKAYTILRDPVDWYKSWVRYFGWRGYDPYYSVFSNGSKLSYEQTIMNAVNPTEEMLRDIDVEQRLRKAKRDAAHISLRPGTTYEWVTASPGGFYSLLVQRLLCRNWFEVVKSGATKDFSNIQVMNTDTIRHEIITMFQDVGVDVSASLTYQVKNAKPVNESRLPNFTLSSEIEDMIIEKDKFVGDWIQSGYVS